MKTTILFMLFALMTLTGCNDDNSEPTVYPEENPLNAYLTASEFNQSVTNTVNNASYWEFGYKFKPLVKGNIKGYTFKIPDAATDVRVTLWDATNATVLKTVTIPNVVANVETTFPIDAFALDPAKEYLVSYNGNDWYDRRKTDGSDVVYPIAAGNISITGYGYKSGSAQVYPTSFPTYYYAGDLSIIFQQTE